MKSIPKIQKYMTANPYTVNVEETLATAQKLMQDHRIRHLPVLNSGKVVGLISERDLALIASFDGSDLKTTKIEQAMANSPYSVSAEASLDEVALEMAEKRYGSAVVLDNNKVVGIFTAVDGLRALSDLLHTRLA